MIERRGDEKERGDGPSKDTTRRPTMHYHHDPVDPQRVWQRPSPAYPLSLIGIPICWLFSSVWGLSVPRAAHSHRRRSRTVRSRETDTSSSHPAHAQRDRPHRPRAADPAASEFQHTAPSVRARSVLTATEDRRFALHLHSTITPCRHMQASTGRLAPTTHNSSATQDSPTANTHTRRPLPTRLLDNAHTCAARANKSRCPSTTTVHAKGDAEVHEKYQSSTCANTRVE
jgi:hypothetical protein